MSHLKNRITYLIYFTTHINHKLHSNLNISVVKLFRFGVIRKATSLINSHHMRTLYFSLFYSILIYGITVWGSAGTIQLNRIVTIHNRRVRLMMPGSTAQCFTTLELLTLFQKNVPLFWKHISPMNTHAFQICLLHIVGNFVLFHSSKFHYFSLKLLTISWMKGVEKTNL